MVKKAIGTCLLLFALSGIAGASAVPEYPAGPKPIQCPGSNAHVWDKDQCPRIGSGGPFSAGGGGNPGGGGGGLLGLVGRVLGGIL